MEFNFILFKKYAYGTKNETKQATHISILNEEPSRVVLILQN